MDRRADQKPLKSQALCHQRGLVAFLVIAYLFVGLGHVAFCTQGAIAATVASEIGLASSDGSEDGDSKKAHVLAERCPVCAPIVMPAPVSVATPLERPVKIAFVVSRRLLEEHPKLDTPPPKHLT